LAIFIERLLPEPLGPFVNPCRLLLWCWRLMLFGFFILLSKTWESMVCYLWVFSTASVAEV